MRASRLKVEGTVAVYHCISRTVGGRFLFEDREREVLRRQIWQVAAFCGVEVLTYAILSNHFHILVRVPETKDLTDEELIKRVSMYYRSRPSKAEVLSTALQLDSPYGRELRLSYLRRMGDISFFMKELKQRFTIWYNKSHGTFGTIWAERFKSLLVENTTGALRALAAYIDLNAVRAGLVSDPKDYRWCGYGEAVAGSAPARNGIKGVYFKQRWDGAQGEHRKLLYLEGGHLSRSQVQKTGSVRRPVFDANKVAAVLNNGGRVSLGEALRCRVRYFSDGAILGSRDFVQDIFERRRSLFSTRRKTGPRRIKGGDEWGELMVFRDLRQTLYS